MSLMLSMPKVLSRFDVVIAGAGAAGIDMAIDLATLNCLESGA